VRLASSSSKSSQGACFVKDRVARGGPDMPSRQPTTKRRQAGSFFERQNGLSVTSGQVLAGENVVPRSKSEGVAVMPIFKRSHIVHVRAEAGSIEYLTLIIRVPALIAGPSRAPTPESKSRRAASRIGYSSGQWMEKWAAIADHPALFNYHYKSISAKPMLL